MTILQLVIDDALNKSNRTRAHYVQDLARGLILTAPRDCSVEGLISSRTLEELETLEAMLPGIAALHRGALAYRGHATAWKLGLVGSARKGMIHAPSMHAPLFRHDIVNDEVQVALTVHDLFAWTSPESSTAGAQVRDQAVLRRAFKHADAVVVPSHSVAERLNSILDFGDRTRVIAPAVSDSILTPVDAGNRRARLGVPTEYLLAIGSLDPRNGLESLLTAMAISESPGIPLVVVGGEPWRKRAIHAVIAESGMDIGLVHQFDALSDADYSAVLSGANALVLPALDEGFPTTMLEAFSLGVPVIHSDIPAHNELAIDAGIKIEHGVPETSPERIAAALTTFANSSGRLDEIRTRQVDRARAFSWRDSAERVWQLHADL